MLHHTHPARILGKFSSEIMDTFNAYLNTNSVHYYLANNRFVIPQTPSYSPAHGIGLNEIPPTATACSRQLTVDQDGNSSFTLQFQGVYRYPGMISEIVFAVQDMVVGTKTRFRIQFKTQEGDTNEVVAKRIANLLQENLKDATLTKVIYQPNISLEEYELIDYFLNSIAVTVTDNTIKISPSKEYLLEHYVACGTEVLPSLPKELIKIENTQIIFPGNVVLNEQSGFSDNFDANKILMSVNNKNLIHIGKQVLGDIQAAVQPNADLTVSGGCCFSNALHNSLNSKLRAHIPVPATEMCVDIGFKDGDNPEDNIKNMTEFFKQSTAEELANYSLIGITSENASGESAIFTIYGIQEMRIERYEKTKKTYLRITPKNYNRQNDIAGYIRTEANSAWYE